MWFRPVLFIYNRFGFFIIVRIITEMCTNIYIIFLINRINKYLV